MIVGFLITLQGCYSIPNIEGFDSAQWNKKLKSCNDNRLSQAEILIEQADKLYAEGEAEIKTLLGNPSEHELYERNQKFFYYNLTPENCPEGRRLSVRFDALDRVKEVMIIEW